MSLNQLTSKLKSQLFESTQNVKFNLLLNTNVQHYKSSIKNKHSSDQKVQSSNNLFPSPNFNNPHNQQQIQAKLQNKLNQLKKRSFSQRKIITQNNTSLKSKQENASDKNLSQRKRLVSASSMSKINNEIDLNFTVKKQILKNKQSQKKDKTQKEKCIEDIIKNKTGNILFGDLVLEPNTINLQQRASKQKLQFITPIKSQRVSNFSIDPSLTKQALQAKTVLFTGQNTQLKSEPIQIKVKQNLKEKKNQTIKNLKNITEDTLTLFFKDGILLKQTEDFKYFQQIIFKKKQSNLFYAQNLTSHLEKIEYFVNKFKISSWIKGSNFTALQSKKVISNWQILNLFHDWKKILQNLKKNNISIKGIIFYFPDSKKGTDLAAHKITMFFREIRDKKVENKMKSLMSKVIKIQRVWRRALVRKKFKQKLLQNAQKKLQYFSNVQKMFIKNYQIIKTSRKVQIHIGSLSFEQFKRVTFDNRNHYESSQISRIFKSLESPDTFIIYVTPIQLSQSVVKYYQRMFKIATGSDLALKQKVYFIYPQNTERISKFCQLTTLNYLLSSPKALKRIKVLIKSIASIDNCYIVPSYPTIEYVNLSYELKIPIFSSSLTVSKLYSSKIGYREIINKIIEKESQNPPFRLLKSVSSIFSQKQLINTLALLIYKNQEIKRWYFKIDDEFNSRGLAYFNVNSINFLKKLNDSQNDEVLGDLFEDDKQIIKLIAVELKDKLRQRLKILHKQIYPTYNQYISHFLTRGGVIQAAPESGVSDLEQMSVSFVIEPNGDFQILGSFNKLQLNSKSICNAAQYPSKNSHQIDIQKIVRHLYRRFYLKEKLFGYFTIDLLVQKTKDIGKTSYVLGLSCFLTIQSSLTKVRYQKDVNSFIKIQFNMDQSIDTQSLNNSKISKIQFQKDETDQTVNQQKASVTNETEKSMIENKNQGISYLYCPTINLPKLQAMQDFFRKCKFQNIAFDLKTLSGTVYLPVNDLEYQNVGFLISQKGQLKMNTQMQKLIQFLSKNYRSPNIKSRKENDEVGMLRGVILSQIHKSEDYKKAQQKIHKQRNCEATLNNLQFF